MKKYWQNFSLEQSLGFILHRTLTAIRAVARYEFQDEACDVTIDQWIILCALWEKEGRSQTELSEKTYKDRATVTRMLDLLEKKGLIFRQQSSADRRIYEVFLTPGAGNCRGGLSQSSWGCMNGFSKISARMKSDSFTPC